MRRIFGGRCFSPESTAEEATPEAGEKAMLLAEAVRPGAA